MTPDSVTSSYRRALLTGAGEVVYVRRYTGGGQSRPVHEVSVRARVMDYSAAELVGSVMQGDRKLILLAEDLVNAQWPGGLRKDDKIVVRGKELNVEAVDDNTRRIGSVLIAYEMQVRG